MCDRVGVDAAVVVGVGVSSSATADECLGAIAAVVENEWKIVALSTLDGRRTHLQPVAEALGVALVVWPAERLNAVTVPRPSERVRAETGTASVAEASAVLASGGGELLVAKTSRGGVTVAVACAVDWNTF